MTENEPPSLKLQRAMPGVALASYAGQANHLQASDARTIQSESD